MARRLIVAGVAGSVIVFVFLAYILPAPAGTPSGRAIRFNLPFVVGYLIVSLVVARRWGAAILERRIRWLTEERAPTAAEQRSALGLPLAIAAVTATIWGVAAVLFSLVNLRYSGELAGRVAATIVMGGLSTCALAYLLVERATRDLTARALAAGAPLRPVTPGVITRAILVWGLATAVPVGGIAFVAFGVIQGDTPANRAMAWSIIFLAVATVAIGAVATVVGARSVADPIRSVRAALARIGSGDHDVEVPVFDASEVGLLQAGFNQMAAGLRERERLRDLFGRHVGEEVARRALESGIELGGETRFAAALFVDIDGSTQLTHDTAPGRVVDLLNAFFALVVEVVDSHGGWINKFEGDAALCVFGVPAEDGDPATDALVAARTLARRLAEHDGPSASIGVSAGEVVAGNVGAARRLEYTIIGDPVNEAARLTELAKQNGEAVLASEAARNHATDDEAGRWRVEYEVVLRGRRTPTRACVPAE